MSLKQYHNHPKLISKRVIEFQKAFIVLRRECYNYGIVKWFPKYILFTTVFFSLSFAQNDAASYLRASAEVNSYLATFYVENVSDCQLESVQLRIAHNSVYFSTDEISLFVDLAPDAGGTFAARLSQVVNDDWQWALDGVTLKDCDDEGAVEFARYDFGTPVVTEGSASTGFTTNPSTSGPRLVYTIEKGDTVFIIAEKFGISAVELMNANGLASEALIFGRTLNVPLAIADDDVTFKRHRVVAGDTLFKIAQRYGRPMEIVQKVNCIGANGVVKLDQDVRIPPEGVTDVIHSCG